MGIEVCTRPAYMIPEVDDNAPGFMICTDIADGTNVAESPKSPIGNVVKRELFAPLIAVPPATPDTIHTDDHRPPLFWLSLNIKEPIKLVVYECWIRRVYLTTAYGATDRGNGAWAKSFASHARNPVPTFDPHATAVAPTP